MLLFYYLILSIHYFAQTLNLYDNKIGDLGVKYLADAVKHSTVTYLLSRSFFNTRHSSFHTDSRHTQRRIQPDRSTRNKIYCRYSEAKQGDILSPSFSYLTHTMIYYMQTLRVLNLSNNKTGDLGAQHLADALKQNEVTHITSPLIIYNSHCSPFRIDAPCTFSF
jgi:hypothetical protein